jgi:hypothetical protein
MQVIWSGDGSACCLWYHMIQEVKSKEVSYLARLYSKGEQ